LRGWQALFLRGVEVPAELPVSISAYRRQQHRWARGSLECARKYIPQVWKQPIPLMKKIEATIHLTGYGVHLLLCALVLLYPVLLGFSSDFKGLVSLFGIAAVFNLTTFSPSLFFLVAQRQLGNRSWKILPQVILISALYAGMMLNTVRAALHILRREKGVFERTPKFGIVHKKQAWTHRRYQIHFDVIIFFELAFALVNALTFYLALLNGSWIIAFYAALFCMGLLYTSGSSVSQAVAVLRNKNKGIAPDE
jgi:hypothetical protein